MQDTIDVCHHIRFGCKKKTSQLVNLSFFLLSEKSELSTKKLALSFHTVGERTGLLNKIARGTQSDLYRGLLRLQQKIQQIISGVLYLCFSTGGDYNRWTYTNGYVNSPAWHMHYRVNQVRNVMVHATPRTLTNRFLPLTPLRPRWAGSHTTTTAHSDQAKKVPRYTAMRIARVKYRDRIQEDRIEQKYFPSVAQSSVILRCFFCFFLRSSRRSSPRIYCVCNFFLGVPHF